MEINVDRSKCAGHAICTIIAPEAFEMDAEGKAIVLPTHDQEADTDLREAEISCPAQAIKVSKD